jgi:phosphoesterase RecJ-like protein
MIQSVPVPRNVLEFIQKGSKFIIAGHMEPDGDCIGSELTLCSVLRRMGKEAIPCSAGPFRRTEVIPYAGKFKSMPTEADKAGAWVILVDCYEFERVGDLAPHLKGLPSAIIDHHASGVNLSAEKNNCSYIDSNAPSVTAMIFSLIKTLGMEPTPEEAQLLLFGLCTDTGFFRHVDENGEEVFLKAAGLIKAGASPIQAFQSQYGGKSFNSRILLGRILSRTRSFFNGRLIITYEEYDDISSLGIESRDSDILYQQLQAIAGVEAIAYIRQEKPERCSVGLRSHSLIDVGAIAESWGGGGHKNAASCYINGVIPAVEKIILDKFQSLL